MLLLLLLSLFPRVIGFKIIRSSSFSHQEITEIAILNVTLHACRAVAEAEGSSFAFPASITSRSVLAACSARESAKDFERSKSIIKRTNAFMDAFFLSTRRHFDNENFVEGKRLITDGLDALKESIKKGNFVFPKLKLGEILHTLQDFFSHSNWIEMGNDKPNSNLISKEDSIGTIADIGRQTCRNCVGNDCSNNILEDILRERILTSGYFSLSPFNSKPKGKCSHGDVPDVSALFEPKGGINKDTFESSHGALHGRAASVAVMATSELLDDVRNAAGDKEFLRMLGVIPGKALCFVIDTTGSMGDDIEAVRMVTAEIINRRVGTKNEPSVYILVPFNDPGFGPLMRTTNADEFKRAINALRPFGGGDFPEMALHGLQLALTGAPPGSEIYLFTDASAKDVHLLSTVTALIERTESVVYFLITSFSGFRRRRSNALDQQRSALRLTDAQSQVYKDLAVASGGQAVEVTKAQLLEATNSVLEISLTTVVTLLQVVRDPGKSENFTFTVDETVTNLTIYITGTNEDFTLVSPSGEKQEGAATNGSLITSRVFVGNLRTVMLKTEVGQWELRMRTANAFSMKITAQTPIDFFSSFLQPLEGSSDGSLIAVENRPTAGANATMSVILLGSDTANLTEVSLVYLSGSGQINGTIASQENGEYLVHFGPIPSEQFTVVVKGQSSSSLTRSTPATFQRQSTTSVKASAVAVTTGEENTVIEPGATLSVNFTVSTNGSGGAFTIRATNDRGFSAAFPGTLQVPSGNSTVGTVQLTVPSDSESGTEVTLTIEAESPGGDVNYVVLSLTVQKKVTDLNRPVCERLSLQGNCSDVCSNSSWQVSVRLSDGVNGTGIERVFHRQGNGTFNTSLTADNDTIATYEASCCSPTVEIVAVDAVGNVGSCTFTVRVASSPATTTAAPTNTTMTSATTNTTMTTTTTSMTTTTTVISTTSMAPKGTPSSLLCAAIALFALQLK